jgi:hypothetical protein
MALTPKDISITREMVSGWIDEFNDLEDPVDTLATWIHKKVNELELDDPMVNTFGHDNLADETHVADMIVADLPSYANATSI